MITKGLGDRPALLRKHSPKSDLMRRHLLGIIALLLFVGGVAGWMWGGGSSGQSGFVSSSCIRVGCVLGTLWLAFPQIAEISKKIPPWLIGAILLGCVVVAVRPRTIAVIAPLVGLLAVMQFLGVLLRPPPPRKKSKPTGSAK